MKKSILAFVVLLVGLATLSGTAMAAEQKYKPAAKMKLSPNFQIPYMPPEEPEPAPQTMQQLCNGCLEAKRAVRVARRELRHKVQQCRNEDYTQADQAAAGCSPSDTVAQCNSKLFNRCVRRERGKVNAATSSMVQTCNALIDKLKQDMSRYQQH